MAADIEQFDRLVSLFGSPQYIYDLEIIRSDTNALQSELPPQADLFYSLKANANPGIVHLLVNEMGCNAEISSLGELAIVLDVGADPNMCLYTGPGKDALELAGAVEAGVTLFSLESIEEARRLAVVVERYGRPVRCLVRMNGAGPENSSSFRMMGGAGQFGMDMETLTSLLTEVASQPLMSIVGTHLYSVSNARSEDDLLAEQQNALELAERLEKEHGVVSQYLGLGGGFSAPFATVADRAKYPRLKATVEAGVAARWQEQVPSLFFESGRHLVGRSGTLLTRVLADKRIRGERYVIVDAGVNVLGGMSALGRTLPLRPELGDSDGESATLVGPLCTPLDVLARNVRLPRLDEGTCLRIPSVGAYGLSASLVGFTSRPPAVETVVDGEDVVVATRLHLCRTVIDHREGDVGAPSREGAGRGASD